MGLKDNVLFDTDDSTFELLATSDDNSTVAYISMNTVREYMIKDGYFIDLSEDTTGCWSFTVKKPGVKIISPVDGDSFRVGDEVTVVAEIENVARARMIVGNLYPMRYIDGFEECIYNLAGESKVFVRKNA